MKAKQLQKTPEFVIQPNIISQSMYSVSTNARRLIAMAMSLIRENNSEYKVEFSLSDFSKSLGLKDGEKQRCLIEAAAKECAQALITLENDGFLAFGPWFSKVILTRSKSDVWDKITMIFSEELWEIILGFKKAFAKIDLIDLGKLQGRYAIRFYELALSYAGFEGKGGNHRDEWYFEHTLDEIRALFQIDPKKYKQTKEFKRNVIDNPIEEVNTAGIGLHIDPDYIRRGKWLIGARFNCRWVKRDEPLPVTPVTETEQENEKLEAAFPEEYEQIFAEELAQQSLFGDTEAHRQAARGRTHDRLREAHLDFFKQEKQPKKKRSPS